MPAAQRRRSDAETARDGLKVLAPQQPQHRCGFALPRHPATSAGRRCARLLRSLRVARPRFDVLLLVHFLTPLRRKSSAYEVSQSTVRRGNPTEAVFPTAEHTALVLNWARGSTRSAYEGEMDDDVGRRAVLCFPTKAAARAWIEDRRTNSCV